MSTYSLVTGGDGYPQRLSTELTVIKKKVDFAFVNGTVTAYSNGVVGSTVAPTGPATADAQTIAVISIPAGFVCHSVAAEILTSGTAGSHFAIQDGTAGIVWVASSAADAAVGTVTESTHVPHLYASETTMDVYVGVAGGSADFPTSGQIEVVVTGFSS
jgi:hypothetical protein